jgi:hypothetical protein
MRTTPPTGRDAERIWLIDAIWIAVTILSGGWLACSSSNNNSTTGTSTSAVSCSDYCTTILMACGNADGGPGNTSQFYDPTNCQNTCALWTPGTFGDNGDTVGCRQAHAHQAVMDKSQCEAAGAGGGGVCGQRCEVYCNMVMKHCTVANGADPPYGSTADCMAACMAYPYDTTGPDYDPNAISKLNCLDYHLRESLSDLMDQGIAGGHCDDLSIDGGTTRGACHP